MQEWRSLVEGDVKQYLHYLIEIDPLCFHRDRKMSISVERRGLPSQLLIQNLVRVSIKGYKLLFPLSVSPGLVVMGCDSQSDSCGFESQHCKLVGHFSH